MPAPPSGKKDHWLPQFYLRYFAIPGWVKKEHAEIWQTDLETGTCSRKKIRDVAYGTEFYSFDDSSGKWSRKVDDALTLLENRVAPFYAELVEGKRDPKTEPRRRSLIALLISTILWRTPDQEQKSAETHQRLQEIFNSVPKSSTGRPLVSYVFNGLLMVPVDTSDYHAWNRDDENTLKQIFAEHILELARDFAKKLFNKRWIILTTDKPVFLTTDSPFFKVDGDGVSCGVETPDAMIFFPLSPTHMLLMAERKAGGTR